VTFTTDGGILTTISGGRFSVGAGSSAADRGNEAELVAVAKRSLRFGVFGADGEAQRAADPADAAAGLGDGVGDGGAVRQRHAQIAAAGFLGGGSEKAYGDLHGGVGSTRIGFSFKRYC